MPWTRISATGRSPFGRRSMGRTGFRSDMRSPGWIPESYRPRGARLQAVAGSDHHVHRRRDLDAVDALVDAHLHVAERREVTEGGAQARRDIDRLAAAVLFFFPGLGILHAETRVDLAEQAQVRRHRPAAGGVDLHFVSGLEVVGALSVHASEHADRERHHHVFAAQRAGAEPAPQLYAAQAVPRSGAGARAGLGLLARLVGVDVALADRRLESQLERELCAALGFGSARSVGAEQGEIAEAGEVPTLLFGRAALGVLVTMQAVDVGRAGGQHQHA